MDRWSDGREIAEASWFVKVKRTRTNAFEKKGFEQKNFTELFLYS
jgi:hypothetical protein